MKQDSIFEYDLTADEIKMFEHISSMEQIYNELGTNLAIYKDSIMQVRNEFCSKVASKYRINNPANMTYDRVSRKLRSIFHPKLSTMVGFDKPSFFSETANDIIVRGIKTLTDMMRVFKRGIFDESEIDKKQR